MGGGTEGDWATRLQVTRALLAKQADEMASIAEGFALILEEAATRKDTERRLRLAAWERENASVARDLARELRSGGPEQLGLAHFPTLRHEPPPVTRPERDEEDSQDSSHRHGGRRQRVERLS